MKLVLLAATAALLVAALAGASDINVGPVSGVPDFTIVIGPPPVGAD
jgi:hypothetical protein